MNQWESVRQLARKKRLEVETRTGSKKAIDLITASEAISEIKCEGLRADDPLLRGAEAVFDPDVQRIWYNREIDPIVVALFQAHEFAHHWLEDKSCSCSASDLDARLAEEKSPLGVDRVESYSPKERHEAQANVFAREFLLPAYQLRKWFILEHWSAADIATYVGVPESLVFHQLIDALLLPPSDNKESEAAEEKGKPKNSKLDPSQEAAAHVPTGGRRQNGRYLPAKPWTSAFVRSRRSRTRLPHRRIAFAVPLVCPACPSYRPFGLALLEALPPPVRYVVCRHSAISFSSIAPSRITRQ